MAFFLYRVARVYPPNEGPTSAFTRFVPEFSSTAGASYRPIYPGDQPQSLSQAQLRLSEILADENSFRDQVISGNLGTLTDFVAYP